MVFLKNLAANLDAGTATRWGGNQITSIDLYFDNVNIAADIINGTGKARINTPTYFRSGVFEIRNPADSFSYIFIGSAIGANRNITIPLLTGNANLVLDSFSNTFTATQTINVNSNDPFTLYKPVNTSLTTWDLNWDANDSVGNQTTYADVRTMIIDNTDGSEDGRWSVNVMMGGNKREVLRLQGNNTTIYNGQSNANGTTTQLEFLGLDSGSLEHAYAMVRSEIVDNTGGSEDGRLEFLTSSAGTLIETMLIHNNGDIDIERGGLDIKRDGNADLLDLERTDNGVGNAVNLNFWLEDSTNALTTYGRIAAEIVDATNASEDGKLDFYTMRGGTLTEQMSLDDAGHLQILNGMMTITKDGSANLFTIYRTDGANNDEAQISFNLQDSASNQTEYNRLTSRILDNTNGSEDSRFLLASMIGGSLVYTHTFFQDGWIELFHNNSTNFTEHGISFRGLDSGAAGQDYAYIIMEKMDTAAGSEDGQLDFDLVRAGAMTRVMKLDNVGGLRIGRDTSNMRGVVSDYNTSTANQFFQNTSAEQTMFSYTVKANTVGADGQITVRMAGYLHQDQVTGTTFTIRIKVGGTTWYSDTLGGTIAQSANSRVWRCELCFYPDNQSSTNGRLDGYFMLNDTTLPTTGIGSIGDDEIHTNANLRSSGTNAWGSGFGSDTTISATVQMSVANANVMFEVERLSITLDPT